MKTDNHMVNVMMLISVVSDGLVLLLYILTSLGMGPWNQGSVEEGFLYQLIPFLFFAAGSFFELVCYFWEKGSASKMAPLICLFCTLLKFSVYGLNFMVVDMLNVNAIYARLSGTATTSATLGDKVLVFTLPLSPVIVLFSGLLCDFSLFHLRRENRR